MTNAIILAAGQGTRLRPLTLDKPKCLVELFGKSLIARQIETLNSCGIVNVVVAGGYKIETLREAGYVCAYNADYENSNMVASLFASDSFIDVNKDLIISYGDIVYSADNLQAVLDCDHDISVMIDLEWKRLWEIRFADPLSDAESLTLDDHGFITSIGKLPESIDEIQGQFTGLIKVRAEKLNELIHFYRAHDFKREYMTFFLQSLIDAGWKVNAVQVRNGWLEVDSVSDLEIYGKLYKQGLLSSLYQTDASYEIHETL